MAAVVIEVETGDILSLVSLPNYDNNRARYDFDILRDPNGIIHHPLINRALYANYNPGSIVKPLIIVAGMEEGKITSDTVINCTGHTPDDWPRCWIEREYKGVGHDSMWPNNARNALKGSCNVFCSHVADMLDSSSLQRWLYGFGLGHKILDSPFISYPPDFSRSIRESPGKISSTKPASSNPLLENLSTIQNKEKRYFGIGQGNLQVTPLQAANAMATLARGGIYMNPRLYKELVPISKEYPLNISQHTLDTIYDGMYAVVNERNGTAYK